MFKQPLLGTTWGDGWGGVAAELPSAATTTRVVGCFPKRRHCQAAEDGKGRTRVPPQQRGPAGQVLQHPLGQAEV